MFKNIVIGVLMLALIAGAVYAFSAGREVEVVPTPTPTPESSAPAEDGHIIPQNSSTPEPEPKEHDYVYNPVEYFIAMSTAPADRVAPWLNDVSAEEIIAFRKQHRIVKGDSALVRGRVINHHASGSDASGQVIVLEGDHTNLWAYVDLVPDSGSSIGSPPKWLSDVIKRLETGEEVVITLRGTAKNTTAIINCELVE